MTMFNTVLATSGACALALSALTPSKPQAPDCTFPLELRTFSLVDGRTSTIVADRVRQWISWEGGSSYVQVGRHERADSDSEWIFREYMFTTDLKITDVTFTSGGQALYVAGIRSMRHGCEYVIEQWDVVFPSGAVVVDVPDAPARGTAVPMPFVAGVAETTVGGVPFVPAPQRVKSPFADRTVLYTGTELGPFAAMEADPEGRFLLALPLSGAGIYSFDLAAAPGAPPSLELDSAAIPNLDRVRKIVVREHEELGRYYQLYETKGDYHASGRYDFLVDGDNDGVFDATHLLSAAEYLESPFADDRKKVSLLNITDTNVP